MALLTVFHAGPGDCRGCYGRAVDAGKLNLELIAIEPGALLRPLATFILESDG